MTLTIPLKEPMVIKMIINPRIILMGMPNWKTFICGMLLEIIPRARSVIKIAAVMGAAILNPMTKTSEKRSTTCFSRAPLNVAPPMGRME